MLPVLSGTLLILTFHPFNVWPLGFVALAPLFYFVAGFNRTKTQVFLGGLIAGGMFSFALSYFTLIQFHWLPDTYLFADAVHVAVIPITLLGGGICGLSLLAYRALRSGSPFFNALLAAAAYTFAELVLQNIFGGYYLATLAYVATPLSPLLSLAAIGGAPFVSFSIAWINGIVAESLIIWCEVRPLSRTLLTCIATFCIVFIPNYIYLHRPLPAERTLTVAVLQMGARGQIFGSERQGNFVWDIGAAIKAAGADKPDLLIYPFSPVEGALYRGSAPAFNKDVLVASEASVGAYFKTLLPATTTLLTWNNLYANGAFYNEFELWQGGAVVSEYQKRALFPFMDYTPAWAARIGLFSTPFDEVAGAPENGLTLLGQPLGDLMCSELHDTALARQEARRAPLIIAVGSEAMFLDDVASEFSLKAAQLRAAENDVPVVRGNILGPSGIIDRFGELVTFNPSQQAGVIEAPVALTASRTTLYNLVGDWLIWLLTLSLLGGSWYAVRARD